LTIHQLKKIYDINFSVIYLPIKNNTQEFMYAPCWDFTYKDLNEYTDEQLKRLKKLGIYIIKEEEMGEMHIIFSAVDGASISAYSSKDLERSQRMRQEHDAG